MANNQKENDMNLPYQVKTVTAQIKDIDMERRIIEGYFSAFGNVDSDGDVMRKGCYAKTIKENGPKGKNRIMHLLQHDPLKPLGKPMELYEDDYGLKFTTVISETQYGTDALKLYKDGVFKEHSVGINIMQDDYSDEDRANIVTEVRMWEGSTVTWGANEMALGGMAKGNSKDMLDRYSTLSKAWYSGDYTDETFQLIEKQMKHLEGHIKNALQSSEPLSDTPDVEAVKSAFDEFNLEFKLKGIFNEC